MDRHLSSGTLIFFDNCVPTPHYTCEEVKDFTK